uniref:uncharacterized protein LOC122581940 n=1 Tax=Erigeron canadensis TaxID=72917 RepID=UPI001CB8B8DB|nr:uncharacterized protein LOC122581940 [Erigeron canadensis]
MEISSSSSKQRSVEYKLPLGEAAATFQLAKAVCSHGFFMTAPNQWDPISQTFRRPLRLDENDDVSSSSVIVEVSQPPQSSYLILRVFDTDSLSPAHQQQLMDQVRRMLRLSEMEERNVREFHQIYAEAKASCFGRMFRSPTLFEDMVKCILVCNCQWSRTLSMAQALCELQLELQCSTSMETDKRTSTSSKIAPETPVGKEKIKRKIKSQENSRNVAKRCAEVKSAMEAEATLRVNCVKTPISTHNADIHDFVSEPSEKRDLPFDNGIGNFPIPSELATLDVDFLAKRCNLGYRAIRILRLAQGVVEGRINLRKIEEDCAETSISNYMKLNEQLGEIYGFGPFTRANVLMCLGFYHVVPSDSETLRHLNQVHGKKSTIKNIEAEIERIYGKYAPFQFLVYWSEIWSFYEERFGKPSELPSSHYKLITAANMRGKDGATKKK